MSIENGGGRRFLRPEEVADRIRVSMKTLRNWRSNGGGPPWTRIGGRLVRYPEEEFNAWARSAGYEVSER